MTSEQYERVRELFLATREKPAEQQAEFLRRACGADEALCAEVESLLTSAELAGTFLQTPALGTGFAVAAPDALAASHADADRGPRRPTVTEYVLPPAPRPERIAQYRILDVLGQGGMGIVYRAEQENPRRIVALKVIRPGVQSRDLLRRFAHEGQVLAWLQHPGIAQVFEAGTTDTGQGPQPFFAMEFIQGRPLTEHAELRQLDVRQRLDLVAKVCDAVQHAHQKGVIHRDLKPGNILADHDGQPKILDFGVARATDADLRTTTLETLPGQLIGTLAYMSPEQISGDPRQLDTRSDVYSLGVICYELLAGRVPLDLSTKTIPQAARALTEDEPPALGTLDRAFRGDLTTIVAKALEKDKNRRYQSASELAEDIRRYLADQPIQARPATTFYQLRKFARRNRPLVAGVVTAFIALTLGLVGTLRGYVQATAQRHTAEAERNRALQAEGLAEQRGAAAEFRAYVANISAAQAALQAKEVATARQQLELAPVHLRNWEWRYLAAGLDASLLTFRGHTDRVWGIAFSADGSTVISASHDGTIRFWDAASGACRQTLHIDGAQFTCLNQSPDGTRLAAGLYNGQVSVWDAQRGELLHSLKTHNVPANDVRFSPDGRWLATTSVDHQAALWRVDTGERVLSLKHPDWVYSGVFNPDGTRLATSCRDNRVRVWSLPSGAQQLEIAVAPNTPDWYFVHSWPVVFSPDGRTLVTGSHDGLVQLWDADSGALRETLVGHTARVRGLAYRPDGAVLASAADDGTVRVWDVSAALELVTLVGHESAAFGLAFSPDGTRLASSSDDHTVRLWDPRLHRDFTRLRGHDSRGIWTLAISPDGTRLVSGGEDGVVRLWDVTSGAGLLALRGHQAPVSAVAYSPDGTLIASASEDRTVRLWDTRTGGSRGSLVGHARGVTAATFSPDGDLLATASGDGTIKLWDPLAWFEVRTLCSDRKALTALAFRPDGTQLASGSTAGVIEFWNVRTGEHAAASPGASGHAGEVLSVAYNRNGKQMVSASRDGTLKLWDTERGLEIATLRGHTDVVASATFSPDGTRIASVSYDRTLRLWDTQSAELVLSFRAHQDYPFCIAFSPDGHWLASAEKCIRLWETDRPDAVVLDQRRARVAAEQLLDRSFPEPVTAGRVLAGLATDATLEADVRRYAEQIARFRGAPDEGP